MNWCVEFKRTDGSWYQLPGSERDTKAEAARLAEAWNNTEGPDGDVHRAAEVR